MREPKAACCAPKACLWGDDGLLSPHTLEGQVGLRGPEMEGVREGPVREIVGGGMDLEARGGKGLRGEGGNPGPRLSFPSAPSAESSQSHK